MALFKKLGLIREPETGDGWLPPGTLDHGAIGRVCCVMDRDGRGQVVWENHGSLWLQVLGQADEAGFARLALGAGTDPRVAANLDGAGAVAWTADVAGGRSVLGLPIAAWRSPGSSRILFSTAGRIHHLQLAADRRGGVMVVWCHELDGSFEVLVKRFDARAKLWDEEPARLGEKAARPIEPRLAMNRRGQAVVVWNEGSRESDALVGSFFLSATKAWSERPVAVATGRISEYQIALDHSANLMVLMVRQDFGQRPTLEARVHSAASSSWLPTQVLAAAPSLRQVRLEMTGTGDALAIWQQSEGSTLAFLYGKAYRDGVWEPGVTRLDTDTGKVEAYALALGSKGQAAMLCLARHQAGRTPLVREWWRGSGWGAPRTLGKPVAEALSQPMLTLCPSGALALWRVGEGTTALLLVAQRRGPGRS